jgi:NitT/TauT family transport system permease protein
MIRRPIKRLTHLLLGILSVVCLLIGYTWLSHRQHLQNPKDTTIPSWQQLAKGVERTITWNDRMEDRWLTDDAIATGIRLFSGLGMAVLGSCILGIGMGCFAPMEAFFHPPLSFMAKVPATAVIAVFMALVGLGMKMYITMIVFGILPTMAISVYQAVKEFPEELQYKAYTLGASHMEVIWTIIFPHILPKLIDALRLMIGPAMVYLIAAEMLFGDVGFGYRIRIQSKLLNMSVVYPYLTVLAGFGFSMDYLLRSLQHKISPWFIARH